MKLRGLPLLAVLALALGAAVLGCTSEPLDTNENTGARCDQCGFLDPWQTGPYPVGVRNELWIDASRSALAWTGCGYSPCPRPLPISIWYPADDAARNQPVANFSAFFSVTETALQAVVDGLTTELGADHIDVHIPESATTSHKDAALRQGRWPVVIFSHGAGGVRFQSIFLTEYLASHGYVVIAPDHEGDATVTEIEGQIVTVDTHKFIQSALDRPMDIQFIMDTLEALQSDPDGYLAGGLALELGFGLTGHSFGSYTSITTAGIDPRVVAIVPMAAPGLSGFGEAVPTLFMLASEDDTIKSIGNDGIRAEFDLAPEPKMLLELLDAGHFTFSNMCDLFPDFGDGCGVGVRRTNGEPLTYVNAASAFKVINGFTTAWFGRYLKGADGYAQSLLQDPFAGEVRYKLVGRR